MKTALAMVTIALVAASAASADEVKGFDLETFAIANCKSPNGAFDLTSLATGNNIAGTDKTYSYKYNLCSVVTGTNDQCTTLGGTFCQYGLNPPNSFVHMLSKWDSTGAWSTCTDATNCPNLGIQVYFQNGDQCGGTTGPKRAVTFIFACPASGGTSGTTFTVAQGADQCSYNVVMQNSIGCQGGNNSGGSGGSSSKGLSGGSIFLIILVVVIPVYIVAGCVYKRQTKGTSGMESCPNVDFWRELPGLVGEGCRFTWRKLMGLCGKSDSGSYENVK